MNPGIAAAQCGKRILMVLLYEVLLQADRSHPAHGGEGCFLQDKNGFPRALRGLDGIDHSEWESHLSTCIVEKRAKGLEREDMEMEGIIYVNQQSNVRVGVH